MQITPSDIEEWSQICYNDEVPLSEVVDALRSDPKAYSLQPLAANRSSLVVCIPFAIFQVQELIHSFDSCPPAKGTMGNPYS